MVNKLNSGKEGRTSDSRVEERRRSSDDEWADNPRSTEPAQESSDEDSNLSQPQGTPEHSGGVTPGAGES